MSEETKAMFWTIVKRFVRAFLAGSIASMLAILASGQFDPSVLKDPTSLIYSLVLGALTGGLQALDKLLRYTPDNQ